MLQALAPRTCIGQLVKICFKETLPIPEETVQRVPNLRDQRNQTNPTSQDVHFALNIGVFSQKKLMPYTGTQIYVQIWHLSVDIFGFFTTVQRKCYKCLSLMITIIKQSCVMKNHSKKYMKLEVFDCFTNIVIWHIKHTGKKYTGKRKIKMFV